MPAGKTSASSPRGGARHDRLVKLAFTAVIMLGAAYLIYHDHTHTKLSGWRTDLQAALKQAARENRPVVVLAYDSATDYTFGRMQEVVSKKENIKAMDDMNAIRVSSRLSTEDARKYGVVKYPASLLLNSQGEMVAAWTGFIGEMDYRHKFLKGEKQEL